MSLDIGEDILNAEWPECPYCGTPLRETAALPEYDDGERDEIACVECGHTYEIRIHMIRSFNCYPLGGKHGN